MSNMIGLIAANYSAKALEELTGPRAAAALAYGGRYNLIDFPLSNMTNSGIRTVGIITPYLYRALMNHIRSGKEWSLDRKNGGLSMLPGSIYGLKSTESKFTIRDIEQNLSFLMQETAPYVVVAGGDIVCNLDYGPILEEHIKSGADITMIYKNMESGYEGLSSLEVQDDGQILSIRNMSSEKTKFIDTFIIGREMLLMIVDWYANVSYFDILDAINDNLTKMVVRGYEFKGYVGNISSVKAYYDCNRELLKESVRNELFMGDNKIITRILDSVPTKYLKTAKVKNSLIPTGCIIKGTVENSVLSRNVVVEENTVVKNSIIMEGAKIGAGAVIENAIIEENVTIEPGVIMKGNPDAPIIK